MTTYKVTTENIYLGSDDTTLQLHEDEQVLDSEFRGANRVVIALLTPVAEEYECTDGNCSRTVSGPRQRCWQHQDDA